MKTFLSLNRILVYVGRIFSKAFSDKSYVAYLLFALDRDNSYSWVVNMNRNSECKKEVSEKEIYTYYLNRELEKIVDSVRKKELTEIENRARTDAEIYVLSGGMVKPRIRESPDVELAKALSEIRDELRKKESLVKEQLHQIRSPKEREKGLDDFLSNVSQKLIDSLKKERSL
jgi:hypothetical protein